MARYIDVDLLLNEIEIDYSGYIFSENCSPLEFINIIENQPTANVKEVVRGEWIFDIPTGLPKCSICGGRCHNGIWHEENSYCGRCGVEMKGE